MSRPPVADQVQVNFRMPADLRDRIKAAAEANNRSANAEIVATLEEKYPAPVVMPGSFADAISRFQEIIEEMEDINRRSKVASGPEEYEKLDQRFEALKEEAHMFRDAFTAMMADVTKVDRQIGAPDAAEDRN